MGNRPLIIRLNNKSSFYYTCLWRSYFIIYIINGWLNVPYYQNEYQSDGNIWTDARNENDDVFYACNDDEINPDNTEDNATSIFKVEYEQSGDVDFFVKSLEIGEGFIYTDTQEEAPITFLDDDLVLSSYSFINEEPRKKIELAVTAGWVPLDNDYAEMKVTLTIYKDDSLIDTKEYITTSEDVSSVNRIKYTSE